MAGIFRHFFFSQNDQVFCILSLKAPVCHDKRAFGQSKTQNSDMPDLLIRLRLICHQELGMRHNQL